jgi:hypothetical protein
MDFVLSTMGYATGDSVFCAELYEQDGWLCRYFVDLVSGEMAAAPGTCRIYRGGELPNAAKDGQTTISFGDGVLSGAIFDIQSGCPLELAVRRKVLCYADVFPDQCPGCFYMPIPSWAAAGGRGEFYHVRIGMYPSLPEDGKVFAFGVDLQNRRNTARETIEADSEHMPELFANKPEYIHQLRINTMRLAIKKS